MNDPDVQEHYDAVLTMSASLPAIFGLPARPWNGRDLTIRERTDACGVYAREYAKTGSAYAAAQAAFEYLSAEAW